MESNEFNPVLINSSTSSRRAFLAWLDRLEKMAKPKSDFPALVSKPRIQQFRYGENTYWIIFQESGSGLISTLVYIVRESKYFISKTDQGVVFNTLCQFTCSKSQLYASISTKMNVLQIFSKRIVGSNDSNSTIGSSNAISKRRDNLNPLLVMQISL